MAHGYSGFVTNGNGTNAHENMLDSFETMLQANGWQTQRKLNTGGTGNARRYELIMKGFGLSGTEAIYIGFQCYQDSTNDYYNISFSVFTGYLSGNTFDTQPGVNVNSVCAHNQRIDYWVHVNGQCIVFALKIGTPVYDLGYMGKFFPDAPPSQFPYPVVCGGTMTGRPTFRYSETTRNFPVIGNVAYLNMRNNFGTWISPYTNINSNIATATTVRDTNGFYHPLPIQLVDLAGDVSTPTPTSNVYGWLDGLYRISGFNNVVENTLTVDGKNLVVIQNVYRTGFADYIALDVTP